MYLHGWNERGQASDSAIGFAFATPALQDLRIEYSNEVCCTNVSSHFDSLTPCDGIGGPSNNLDICEFNSDSVAATITMGIDVALKARSILTDFSSPLLSKLQYASFPYYKTSNSFLAPFLVDGGQNYCSYYPEPIC